MLRCPERVGLSSKIEEPDVAVTRSGRQVTGTIPVHGHFNYKVIESGALGIARTNVLESIDAQVPKG